MSEIERERETGEERETKKEREIHPDLQFKYFNDACISYFYYISFVSMAHLYFLPHCGLFDGCPPF